MPTRIQARCPTCGMELLEFSYEGVRIDQCAHCEGIWLDAGELRTVARARKAPLLSVEFGAKQAEAEARERDLPPGEAERLKAQHRQRCPRCDVKLVPVGFRDRTLDRCPQCSGIWLEAEAWDHVAGAEHGAFKAFQRFIHGDE